MKGYKEIQEDCRRLCSTNIYKLEEKLKGLRASIKLLKGVKNSHGKSALSIEKSRLQQEILDIVALDNRITYEG